MFPSRPLQPGRSRVRSTSKYSFIAGAGIAYWLERRTRDRKVVSFVCVVAVVSVCLFDCLEGGGRG